ncbi:prostaglandin D2 receptor 2 [Austrofundulus limnaeus]|uniref:Prostaglandin D2 receptor 2 n=1 Tax=Austrofundulus limnaeus TaxID=52670 RepID=A0A2I4C9J8_AUSLI|nr:PREDICTED: prostaglandin D2 receptor 2-like [Austrofundulus limnaeus]
MTCPSPNGSTMVLINQTDPATSLTSVNILTITLHGIVSTIGIVENLLILGIVGFRVRRSIISIWILNLAASDFLATCFLPFFTLYMARGNTWMLGPTFCRIYSSSFFLNMFVSAFLLAAISLDRCLVVVRPVWAQNYRTVELVGKICGAIWFAAVIFTIPFYLFRDTIQLSTKKVLCYYNYARLLPSEPYDLKALCKQRKEGLVIMKFLFAFLIPLLIIIFSYVAVNRSLAYRGCRRSFRFVRLVVAVVVTFILCWAPYHIFIIMEMMAPNNSSARKFATSALPISATVGFLNSVINPILYVFSCPDLCRKIRHSLGAVMESVLAEDLAELARRRSTRTSVSNSELGMRKKSSTTVFTPLKAETTEQVEFLTNSS